MKKFTIIFTLILTTFAANSNAQYAGGVGSTWNNPVSAMLSQKMWGDINGKMLLLPALRKLGCTQAQINKMNLSQAQNALAKKTCTPGSGTTQNTQTSGGTASASTTRPKTPAKPTTPPAAVYSTTFKPTGTRIAMPQIVAQITPNDRALQQRQIDFLETEISKYENQQRPRGYGDDAAAAMAFFASVAIHLQDTSRPVNQKGVDSLTDALRGAFGDKLAGISDRDKQELYENLLTLGMFIAARAENADAKTRADLRELSASLCDQYLKLDVTKYRFDDDGLVEIRSAKNVPAPGGKAIIPPSGGKTDPKLIGQWEYKLSNIDTRTYIFRSDATFYFSVIEGTTIYTWTGNYTVSDKTITFKNIVSSTSIGGKRNWADTVAAEYKFEKRDDGKGEWLLIAPLSIPDRTYLSLSLTSAKWSKTAKTTANLEKATPKVEPKPETASQGNGTFTKGKIDPKLIGSWQASTAEIYVFHPDGRFNHFSTQSQVEGRFTVSGGKIHFSNIVYEKGKTWEKRYPDAIYEYELGKDGQGDYLKIPNFLYGVTYVDIKTAYKFRK